MLLDSLQRPLHDLRISVTDRCNFRCNYCMPKHIFKPGYKFLNRSELLSFEEIEQIARVFVGLGVEKIRLTGGEPLIRRDLENLVAMLAAIPNLKDLSLTTNASLLTLDRAIALREAGLKRVNISLDAIDDPTFKALNDMNFPVGKVLTGIGAALEAGFESVKVNMVVQKGVNDHSILPMVEHFRNSKVILRFIEYMDVGNANGWQLSDVFTAQQTLDLIQTQYPVEAIGANYLGEVAKRWKVVDSSESKLEIGLISSVSQTFCHECSRARLSAIGQIYTCLFAGEGQDIRSILREAKSPDDLRNAVSALWQKRKDRYSEERASNKGSSQKVEMSYIGG
ncbi:MAG: cyclic pyranopterin phosphate synthase [Saprospiraceae bacterium]|jgi:cyclic pyranopterin phosphate synthase